MPVHLKDFDEACIERLKNKPKLKEATLVEAINQFFSGNLSATRFHLNHYVQATMGIKTLSTLVKKDNQLLKKKLADNGKPTLNEFCIMFNAIQQYQGIKIEGQISKAAPLKKDQIKSSNVAPKKTSSNSYKNKLRKQS